MYYLCSESKDADQLRKCKKPFSNDETHFVETFVLQLKFAKLIDIM